jgi:hypothetical protein
MQRAISYISLFLSDFDIEDPDHDLAGFGDGGDYETRPVASVDSAMSTQHMAVSMSGTHITASISGTHASDSYDRVFELPNFELAHGQRIEEGEEEKEEGQQQQQASSRSGGVPIATESSNRNWLSWLRRRWSPLKEGNLTVLAMEDRSTAGPWLLERYLTEQTRLLEIAQAELIKRETQLETGDLDQIIEGHPEEDWEHEKAGREDDALSHNFSEASTTKFLEPRGTKLLQDLAQLRC